MVATVIHKKNNKAIQLSNQYQNQQTGLNIGLQLNHPSLQILRQSPRRWLFGYKSQLKNLTNVYQVYNLSG